MTTLQQSRPNNQDRNEARVPGINSKLEYLRVYLVFRGPTHRHYKQAQFLLEMAAYKLLFENSPEEARDLVNQGLQLLEAPGSATEHQVPPPPTPPTSTPLNCQFGVGVVVDLTAGNGVIVDMIRTGGIERIKFVDLAPGVNATDWLLTSPGDCVFVAWNPGPVVIHFKTVLSVVD